MTVNAINNLSNNLNLNPQKSDTENASAVFSKMLDNLKHGRAADYDEAVDGAEGTTTMTQIMSDGSVLVTVTDAQGKIVSQTKTRSINPDPHARVIDTVIDGGNVADNGAALLNMLGQS